MSDAVSKSITYVQRNTMEVIRLGRSIITAVSRAVFIFFMTLMLGAYMMITRRADLRLSSARWSFPTRAARSTCSWRASTAASRAWCAVSS